MDAIDYTWLLGNNQGRRLSSQQSARSRNSDYYIEYQCIRYQQRAPVGPHGRYISYGTQDRRDLCRCEPYISVPQSKVVGIIGAGAQAVTQLHALSTQFNVERVLVCDVINMAATTFSQRTAFMNLPIEVVPSDERSRVVAEADILVTATSNDIGSGPVFEDTETKPWLHINAVGADFPGKIEVPYNLLRRAFVCPDFMAQAEREGECQQLESDEVGPQLYELARNPALYRAYQNKLTVFDSTGWAVEDAVAAQMMLDIAREYGIGQKVAIENLPHDPLNPYDFAS